MILEYTRWPGPPRALTLCIATAGPFGADLMAALPPPDGPRPMRGRLLPPNAIPPGDCDALIVGGWHEPMLRSVLAAIANRPVLTIGVGPHFCDAGGQFCLLPRAPGGRFGANFEAIARSGLMVNPRVLNLARPRLPEPPS